MDSDASQNKPHHPYTYVFIRKDIPLHQQLVQVGHAALEAGFRFPQPDQTSSLIVLEVPDKQSLLSIQDRLTSKAIEHYTFFEPDFDMGESAICTTPILRKNDRYWFRQFPLWGKGDIA